MQGEGVWLAPCLLPTAEGRERPIRLVDQPHQREVLVRLWLRSVGAGRTRRAPKARPAPARSSWGASSRSGLDAPKLPSGPSFFGANPSPSGDGRCAHKAPSRSAPPRSSFASADGLADTPAVAPPSPTLIGSPLPGAFRDATRSHGSTRFRKGLKALLHFEVGA